MESRITSSSIRLAVLGLAVAGLQACAPQATRTPTRQYFVDQGGIAPTCTTSKIELKDGQEATAEMTVGGGAGRCSFSFSRDGNPYGAGLLTLRPEHGKVYVHTVGDDTRIDYTPQPTHSGPDRFVVTLVPGNASLRVNVTAIASPAPPPPAVTAPTPAKPTPAPTRKRSGT